MNNIVVEYESDGKINVYAEGSIHAKDIVGSDFIATKLVAHSVTADKIVAKTATEPLPEPQRVASWLDIIQPNGKPPEPSPWTPPTLSQLERKALGKLGEETNELGTVLFRIHLQGIDEQVPGETKTNRQWLEEEIADVLATASLAVKKLKLDMEFIEQRVKKKTTYLEKWYMTPDIDKEAKID